MEFATEVTETKICGRRFRTQSANACMLVISSVENAVGVDGLFDKRLMSVIIASNKYSNPSL